MKYVIVIVNLIVIIYLFKKAAGNLKIKSLNIISYAFYGLLLFEFFGVSLAYLGFEDHYLIRKVVDNITAINGTYWAMVWLMISLPLSIIIFNKHVYKIHDVDKAYEDNIKKDVVVENKSDNKIFITCVVTFIICLIATIYVFYCIGYVPLFKLFQSGFDFATERINLSRNFAGNQYIRNIVMMIMTPVVSYISYTYMRVTKDKKWKILFIFTLIACIFIKTYDFSKAPIVYYLIYFVFIEILLNKIKKIVDLIPYAIGTVVLVIFSYLVISNYQDSFISLSSGPMSRVLMTQSGTLLLHFDAFPNKIDYLNGHSFPRHFKIIFGEGDYNIRSGRKVMEYYNKKAVKSGTAGVMSTVFIGEAYANFGIIGIILSPILVGFILSSCLCIYLKSKKTVLNICLYLETLIIFTTIIQSGFVEFIYNVNFVIVLLFFLIIKSIINHNYLKNLFCKIRNYKKKGSVLDNKKRMIFHIPNYLDSKRKSGSQIRPLKMIEAFRKNGYEVDVVMGYGKDRQTSINQIKENINNGIKYDFLYSESSTMPTLLTEKNHLPLYPNLDFSFFKFCKKHGIKVGLFYRDIYWKFDEYKNKVSIFKRMVTFVFYKYDLFMYKKLVDVLYLPSFKMGEYIPEVINKIKISDLPPGIEKRNITGNKNKSSLNLLYVGGITEPDGIYGVAKLMETIKVDKRINVYICCRENDWNTVKNSYKKYLGKQVKIVHVSGKELEKYYNITDLCSLVFPYNEYRSFSMPIKFFEYLSHGIPVITTPDTVAADFVEKNDVGFVVKYDEKDISDLMIDILKNRKMIDEKKKNIKAIINKESWEARAKKVESDLK